MLRATVRARYQVLLLTFLLPAVMLASAAPAHAQVNSASIAGTITDSQGGVLPGVTLTVTNAESGTVRTGVTEADGKYRVAGISPGRYNLTAELPGFQTVAVKDITLQIAAGHPIAVSREQVPAEVITKEREIAAQSDRLKGKPPQAIEKIIQGMIEKFFQTNCLLDQGFVKKNSEVTVREHVAGVARKLGDEISIRRFLRFQVGETPAA